MTNNIKNNEIERYQAYVEQVRQHETRRLGYPVVGAVSSDEGDGDYALGIVPNSIADIYLNNIGNPYDLPKSFHHHSKIFEQEVIAMTAKYLGLTQDTRGYITTGGTEGNFAGLWWAREHCLNHSKNRIMPRLFTSDQAHYSIIKAANQLALELEIIPSTSRGAIDLQALERSLRDHESNRLNQAVIVVATAGTTQKGAIDNVIAIRDLLYSHIIQKGGQARLHLDAALIGLALPVLMPDAYANILQSVDSIAMSAHKIFASRAIISGLVLTNQSYLNEVFSKSKNKISYIGDIHDITVSGSRSGFQAIALHHRLIESGFNQTGEPLKAKIRAHIELSHYLYNQFIQIIPEDEILLGDNQFTLTFPRPKNAKQLIHDYSLMPLDHNRLGICVLSHVTKSLLDDFIRQYRECIHE